MGPELNTSLLAAKLREKRGDKGLRETAKEIGGVSAPTLSRIEKGNVPDVDTYLRICKWLEVSSDIFTNTKSTSSSPNEEEYINFNIHLRADKELKPSTVNTLIKLINLSYADETNP